MSKSSVSRFFAWVGFVLLVVADLVVGLPHVFLGEAGLFWFATGVTSVSLSFAIDHTANFFGLK